MKTTNQHYSIDQNQSHLDCISNVLFANSVSSIRTNENKQQTVHVEETEVNNDDSTSNLKMKLAMTAMKTCT